MKLANLTPHEISVRASDGTMLTIPPSGTVARAEEERENAAPIVIDGVEIGCTTARFGAPLNLPDPVAGTIYVVSAIVKAAAPDRSDLVSPGPAIRDDYGRIIGCDGFTR